jgi:hypothetical protein
LISSADRIILSAKLDTIVFDSKVGIEINAPLIKMGVSSNKEPLLRSDPTIKLLQMIINTIKIGFKDSAGTICTPINKQLSGATVNEQLKKIKNWQIMVDSYK